jgi:hypothetical protein
MVTTMRAEERAWPAAVSRRDDDEAMSANNPLTTPSTSAHPDAQASADCCRVLSLSWGDVE